MPLTKCVVTMGVDSSGQITNGPSTPTDPFLDQSTTRYTIGASGAGTVSNAFASYRGMLVAGYEEFDLNNVSTPLQNNNQELIAFDRVKVAFVRNYSTTANLTINEGPDAAPLFTGTLGPGERMEYDAGPTGLGRLITAGTASKFRVASDAADAIYSIYFAGTTTYAMLSATATTVATGTAALSVTPVLIASASVVATGLGTLTVNPSLSASATCVCSTIAAASSVAYPP